MEKNLTIEEVVDSLVVFGVVTEQVGALMLESDAGPSYENILTDENNEPTNFLQGLLAWQNQAIELDEDAEGENRYIVTEIGVRDE